MSEDQAFWAVFGFISATALLWCLYLNHRERKAGLR